MKKKEQDIVKVIIDGIIMLEVAVAHEKTMKYMKEIMKAKHGVKLKDGTEISRKKAIKNMLHNKKKIEDLIWDLSINLSTLHLRLKHTEPTKCNITITNCVKGSKKWKKFMKGKSEIGNIKI